MESDPVEVVQTAENRGFRLTSAIFLWYILLGLTARGRGLSLE